MIWGKKWDVRKNPFKYWQLWFAWYPVPLSGGRWAWLCWVEWSQCGWEDVRTVYREPIPGSSRIEEEPKFLSGDAHDLRST